jgi:hypothetical protein
LGILCLTTSLAVVLAIPVVRKRIRDTLVARCAAVTEGACEVAEVHLAREGLVATRLRVHVPAAGVSAEIGAVSVRWSWWRLLTRATQGVAVQVSNVSVHGNGSPRRYGEQLQRLLRRPRRASGASRVRVERIEATHVTLDAAFGNALDARIDGLAGEWNRGGDLEIRWEDASVAGGADLSLHSGACSARRSEEAQFIVDCSRFAARLDTSAAEERLERVHEELRAFRAALQAPLAEPAGGNASPPVEPSRTRREDAASLAFVVRGREGAVVLARGAQEYLELRPAVFQADVESGRLRTFTMRFGREGAGPAVQAELALPSNEAWLLDLSADSLPLGELASWVPGIPWHDIEHGRTHLRLHAAPTSDAGVVLVDGELTLEGFGVEHPGLAREPIDGLAVSLRGAARIDWLRRRIDTEGIELALNGVTVGLAGWVERSGGRLALDASLRLPTTGCDAIRRALPPVIVGPLVDLRFAGSISADLRLALDTGNLPGTQLDVDVSEGCAVVSDGMAQGMRRLAGPFVQRVLEPQGPRAFVTGPGSAAWVSLTEIPAAVAYAVLSREDGRFYRHRGIDVSEIRGAIVRNVGAGRFAYGASTISMQLAKNIFLAREKTLVRKLQEVVFTWYLERSLDKDSILELYLNVVEFGPGIYGIGPAARFFFAREPRDLTPLQAIYLATLLPNPVARFVNYQRGGVSAETLARLRAHARLMTARGLLTPAEYEMAETEGFAFRPASAPVPGVLTQTVDPSTSDAVAASMAPPRVRPAEEASSESDEPSPSEERVAPRFRPVSVRVGGTL